jgi:hypothetical protein
VSVPGPGLRVAQKKAPVGGSQRTTIGYSSCSISRPLTGIRRGISPPPLLCEPVPACIAGP